MRSILIAYTLTHLPPRQQAQMQVDTQTTFTKHLKPKVQNWHTIGILDFINTFRIKTEKPATYYGYWLLNW